MTNFGVPADDAGVDSGITTIVDAGSAGAWMFGGFRSRTDARSFVSINVAGALKGGMRGDVLQNPGMVDLGLSSAVPAAGPSPMRWAKCCGPTNVCYRNA